MTAPVSFIDGLKLAADKAAVAETEFRNSIAQRIKALEDERAFAFRRYNLMRAVADIVGPAESEEAAVAAAHAVLRSKLGWASDSEARQAVLVAFAPVARALFLHLAPPEDDAELPDIGETLAEFERWYAATHPVAFWKLFETYMPETPVVDF